MDNGAALLHPRRPLPGILEEGFIALGITHQGIPFGGSRELTDVFWLICSVDDRSHLQALARISRMMANEDFLPTLRECLDPTEVYACVERFESELEESR
jgi:PTS system nitrogen regulatory IIA component